MATTNELVRHGVDAPGDSRRDSQREQARRRLATPQRLRTLFAPRSVALVGASEASGWTRYIMSSLRTADLPGRIMPVHRRNPSVFGEPAVTSLRELPEPVDLVFSLVPTDAVEALLDETAEIGVRNVIVLASGFGESGEAGRQRERRLTDIAIDHDLTILGPNCLGYVNSHAKAAPFGLQLVPPLQAGPVGIVLQSGALASAVMTFARTHAVGISLLTSMGNEAVITAADVIDHLIEDEATKVIALFLESIRDPQRFTALADKALAVGKPIVALKVGRSEAGQATALAHTGAIAGDDAVVAAVLRQHGVIRVDSLEDLLMTAGLFGYVDPPAGPRMGVVTASGGACDIIADRATDEGIEIPVFASSTVDRLTEVLPPFAAVRNPLDITGVMLADLSAATSGSGDAVLNAVADDPSVDFIFHALPVPMIEPQDTTLINHRLAGVVAAQQRTDKRIVHFTTTCTDISPYGKSLLNQHGLHVLGGIEFGVRAVGHVLRWSATRQRYAAAGPGPATPPVGLTDRVGPWSEAAARGWVAEYGVPVVPAELATSADAAVAAAATLGYPVVLKVCSAALTHKSDVGGVALGLLDAAGVADAYERVCAAGLTQTDALDGVLVAPMRAAGTELFAGVTVDPAFGPVLAVGLGGVFIEVLHDVSLRGLPVSAEEIERMLTELRGAAVLRGARGAVPADTGALARAIAALADAALALGPALDTVEINPLWVHGSTVEALDVLIVTRGPNDERRNDGA